MCGGRQPLQSYLTLCIPKDCWAFVFFYPCFYLFFQGRIVEWAAASPAGTFLTQETTLYLLHWKAGFIGSPDGVGTEQP